jgi:acetyl esterase/lipase
MKLKYILFMLIYFNAISEALSAKIKIEKDIPYGTTEAGSRNQLDIYFPEQDGRSKDVLVFIHGGSWRTGKKNTYWWLGRNFASKNVVEVNINYRLAPGHQYDQMAADAAAAIKWVKNNVSRFGGNPDRIFVMGHSAGGHLAALINSDPRFFNDQGIDNPIRGIILNDSFGLDMHEYLLTAEKNKQTDSFLNTFSIDPEIWKTGSPLNYFDQVKNPYLILVGERTYPTIQMQSKRLYEKLLAKNHPVRFYKVPRKKHVGMISQMVIGTNVLYARILDFMATH